MKQDNKTVKSAQLVLHIVSFFAVFINKIGRLMSPPLEKFLYDSNQNCMNLQNMILLCM